MSSLESHSEFPLAIYFTYCALTHVHGTKKDGTDEPICKTAMEMQTWEQRYGHRQRGRRRDGEMKAENVMEAYTPPYVKERDFSESELLETDVLLVPVSV